MPIAKIAKAARFANMKSKNQTAQNVAEVQFANATFCDKIAGCIIQQHSVRVTSSLQGAASMVDKNFVDTRMKNIGKRVRSTAVQHYVPAASSKSFVLFITQPLLWSQVTTSGYLCNMLKLYVHVFAG